MRFLVGLLVLIVTLAPARAAELVMFTQRGCPWCEKFDREIAPAYAKTAEGKRAPLRRVDIAKPQPPDLAFILRERFTPVFVLIDNGREIGRIRGYPGDAFFFGLLANLIAQMDRGETSPPDPSAPAPRGATFGE
jgi:thioredoxin-related protein